MKSLEGGEFEPTESFTSNVNAKLDVIFEGTVPEQDPEGFLLRSVGWRVGTTIFAASEQQSPPTRPTRSLIYKIARVIGLKVADSDYETSRWVQLIRYQHDSDIGELRTYDYRRPDLQVANLAVTKEQATALLDRINGEELTKNLWDEFGQRIYTPSETECLDYLADLSSFEIADEVFPNPIRE